MPQVTENDNGPDVDKAVTLLKSNDLKPISKMVHELFKHRDIMSDSLVTLDNVIGKVEKILLSDQKIEQDVAKSISDMISNIIRSEHTHRVTHFDENSLKMTIGKPRFFYDIREKSDDGLCFLLGKVK